MDFLMTSQWNRPWSGSFELHVVAQVVRTLAPVDFFPCEYVPIPQRRGATSECAAPAQSRQKFLNRVGASSL
jgi:hypothetical protein